MATRGQTKRASTASDSDPDVQIGEFVRGKEIGKGSFATVYLASHRKRRSYAAVKVVTQGKLTKKLKENLESEIRILKGLQHPHIVALFSCIETPAYIYLVMEYCQLSDLAQFMKKRDQLPMLPETADIFKKYPNTQYGLNEVLVRHFFKQIASALDFLRQRNLIHRDIKPQNLLLNPSPAYMARQKPEDVPLAASEQSLIPRVGIDTLPMLKVADFGFARHLPQTMMAETLCGSPLYMAPEILSYQKYDAKADLWSVGTVAYEMLVGKPPFRAVNHIELLRKIESSHDSIPFPAGLAVSADLKKIIRQLLKRYPTERIAFESFFNCPTVIDPIPGLVGEDLPRTNHPVPDPGVSEISRRMQQQAANAPEQRRPSVAEEEDEFPFNRPAPSRTHTEIPSARRPSSEQVERGEPSNGATQPVEIRRPRAAEPRPAMLAHATAPAREYLTGEQYSPRTVTGIRRQSSKTAPSPSTSVPRENNLADRTRAVNTIRGSPGSSDRERTAQDLAFEKEYVMIEKRAVVVNAFADELAASPQLSKNRSASGQQGALIRRATTQGAPNATTGAQPSSPSSELQAATGRRLDIAQQRQASYERRYAPNPSSATNMLSKALNMANARLFGVLGGSPPLGPGASPPRGYGAFPSYPTTPVSLAITDGKDIPGALDEDARILRTVEEAATRSDTVYSFAEVKYRQLLPATPSADEGHGIRQINAVESPAGEGQDLTQTAVVAVSEEALVLFVKALAILAKAIDLASSWWSQRAHGEPTPDPSPRSIDNKSNTAEVSKRMNNVVQWARNRFNECLEKSEIVGRRLIEAQKQLPSDHPGHPNNRSNGGKADKSSGSTFTPAGNQIQLISGVTAEKLMFDRAVEMSRSAAVNELVGQDLKGSEISYRTAIILLEAVLEGDDEPLMPRPSADKSKPDDELVNGMEKEDRKMVVTLIEGTRGRLKALCRKIQVQLQAEREQRRASAATPPKPTIRASPPPSAMLGDSPRSR
ncbi:hypothetical protein MBLNU457_g2986t1 [Dothideomycetes sp. NU457]